MCNEDKCNNKETETTKKIVESNMTFEKAMGRMSNDPNAMEDLVKKKTGSTGSSESPRGSGIKNCIQTLFFNLIIFKN